MSGTDTAAERRRNTPGPEELGPALHELVRDLYPICRSITGDGLRETLRRIGARIPLSVTEVPTGTPVFDWTVPREWNIRDAYIKDSQGRKIVDFRESNLHLVNYSVPVRATMTLESLRPHLFTLPDHPQWIPYVTSYYNDTWGFCLSHERLLEMSEGEYEVVIDSSLETGSLSYGECYLPGEREDEVLISAHACHPSLCNDNLSGIAVAVFLAGILRDRPLRYSYRFLFAPGTIGAITWLARNQHRMWNLKGGLVLACIGDSSPVTYKKSRQGDAEIDRAFEHILRHCGEPFRIEEFSPSGFDERQFCSPGFDAPVGCLMRAGSRYAESHSSADNPDLVRPEALAGSLLRCLAAIELLESNRNYIGRVQKCEPHLGKRGLYRTIGGRAPTGEEVEAMRWVLNYSDGGSSLLDIAERSGIPFERLRSAAEALLRSELLDATC